MSNLDKVLQKADLALGDLTNDGGYLTIDQANRFVRKIVLAPTLIGQVRTINMSRPTMEINKIGFTSRVLQAAKNSSSQNGGPYNVGSRAPTSVKPTTSKITLETVEVIGMVQIPYEVLEDNIERAELQTTILELMAEKAAVDLEELLIQGDTASGDSYLALQNGVMKRVSSNIVNHGNASVDVSLFGNMLKAIPERYHRLMDRYRFYMSSVKEIDYRMQVAQRQTQLGDAIISGAAPVSALGVRIEKAGYLPAGNVLLTIPSNIIFGIQRQMSIEWERNIKERTIDIVMTMRVASQIEEEDMVVKATNVA